MAKGDVSPLVLIQLVPCFEHVDRARPIFYRVYSNTCSIGFRGLSVGLTLCCFVVYSTRRFVLCLTVCYFVLEFFSPFSIAITSLGEERANLSAFCTFVRFVLVWF